MKRKIVWATVFSICFMVYLLSRIEWQHFSLIADRLEITYLIAASIFFTLGNFIRAVRFYKLDHMDKKLTHWWHINAFYNFITSTLPGGSGEAATAYVIKRFSQFNILGALRILLLTRLMDVFAISSLFFVAAIMMRAETSYREAAIWLSGILFLISSVTLMHSSELLIMKLLQKIPGRSTMKSKISEKLSELIAMSQEQRRKSSYAVILMQSVIMMITGIVSVHLALEAFGVDFTLLQSFYCYGIYAIFQIIPVQGVAGIGTQAAWWTIALNAASYDAPDAIAMGFVLYGVLYFFVTATGLVSMMFWMNEKKNA